MSISAFSRRKKRSIGDSSSGELYSNFEFQGQVASFSRSSLKLNNIKSLLPICRGRLASITQVAEAVYLQKRSSGIDLVRLELSSKKQLISTAKTSVETYIVKGLSLPAKKVTSSFVSAASINLFSSVATILSTYLSSFIGFSINFTLAYRDLRKNGGSPAYESFIMSSHGLNFLVVLIGGMICYLSLGISSVGIFVLASAAIFFIFNTIVNLIFRHFDRRTAARIETEIIEHEYALAKVAIPH